MKEEGGGKWKDKWEDSVRRWTAISVSKWLITLCYLGPGFDSRPRRLVHKCIFPPKTSGDHRLSYGVRTLSDAFAEELSALLRGTRVHVGRPEARETNSLPLTTP